MAQSRIRVGLVGASGYAGAELLNVLAHHPNVKLTVLTSRNLAGKTADNLVPGLPANTKGLAFQALSPSELPNTAEAFFLALPHGVATEYAKPLLSAGKVVLDLSADFRIRNPAIYEEFYGTPHPAPELLNKAVYGLPELHRESLRTADLIASPGCYPTSILLALAPALRNGLVDPTTIIANSMSGVTGAGRKADISLLFAEINENLKAYGVPKHRHLSEIEQELSFLASQPVIISFVPHLVPVSRGIFSTVSANLVAGIGSEEVEKAFASAYAHEPFVEFLAGDVLPETRFVLRSNRVQLATHIDKRTGRLLIFVAEDNLGKGAGLQTVQSFNIRFGLPEVSGLGR